MECLEKDPDYPESGNGSECDSYNSDESYINEDDSDSCEGDSDDDEPTSDSAENFFDEVDAADYVFEAVKVLQNHAEVNLDNALVLNRNLQDMLETLRRKIISTLNKCREKYIENQEKLSNSKPVITSLTGIGSCAAPFFKDGSGRPCPPNADYKYRSEVEMEFFPSDLALFPHFVWTAKDKLGILQGIKEQAMEHIERKETYPSTSSGGTFTKLSKNVKLHSLKLTELLDDIDNEFAIDWNQISVYNLGSRHTANSCFAIWNVYLKPEINRDAWTDAENIKLNTLAKKHKFQDWIAIAAEMKGRSDYQCFVQYQTVVSLKMREDKGERWTKEEDELLLKLVEKHRMGNVIRWNPICSQLPNRTKQQCFARYKYGINPSILRAPFTQEEDCIILAAVEEYGENFVLFPKTLFPNRTVVQIRNRYNNSIKNRETVRSWTPEDDKMLLQYIAKYGNHDWKIIAEQMKTHSRTSCRTRFLVISKFLKDNPNATVNDLPRKNRGPLSCVTKNNWVRKITEIKQNCQPNIIKVKKKDGFRFKLRRNELSWYNYLKFAYDFKFGKGYGKALDSCKGLEFVSNVFDVHLQMPITLEKPYTNGIVRASLEKLMRLRGENKFSVVDIPQVEFRLPPSYSTMLALRGLCIMTAGYQDAVESPAVAVKELAEVEAAKKKFRQRLISLLYKTVLLSRLEPENVVSNNCFEVVYHRNTHAGQIAGRSLAEMRVAQMNNIAENIIATVDKVKKRKTIVKTGGTSTPANKKQKIDPK